MTRSRATRIVTLGCVLGAVAWYGRAAPRQSPGGPPERTITPARHTPVTSPQAAARGTLRTATFWAQSLGVRKRYVIWLPPSYERDRARRYPTVYYLHGLFGNETNWTQLGGLDRTLDSLVATGMPEPIVIMPDGDDGWYTTWNSLGDYPGCRGNFTPRDGDTVDSYCVPWLHYDDYIARDLVAHVDATYRTLARREARAAAGLSMGGFGAVTLALVYPEVFAAAASHSGTLSPRYIGDHPFAAPPVYAASMAQLRERWGPRLYERLHAAFGPDTAGWRARDPAVLARRLVSRPDQPLPRLAADVGRDDDFLDQNRAFRHELQQLSIPLEYAEYPGKHDWAYWRVRPTETLRWLLAHLSF